MSQLEDDFPPVQQQWALRWENGRDFFKTVVFKKLLLRFCEFGHYAFASFGFTELKSQKHYPWCCTQQTSAIQQKHGSSTIAGPCHSWRSSSDRYRVALFPWLVSPVNIAWPLYFSNTVVRTAVITIIFFLKGWFTAFIFWPSGHMMFDSHLRSDSQNVMAFLSYAFLFGGKNIFLVAIFCQNIIWGMLLLFFLMGLPNDSHYNLLLCYNWLGCSFLADKPMLSNSKASWSNLSSENYLRLLSQLYLNLLYPKIQGSVFYKKNLSL